MGSYTNKLTNSDDYKFGDEARFGVAGHYTPNYDVMFGVEADLIQFDKNEINGNNVGNSGGTNADTTGARAESSGYGVCFRRRYLVGL